MEKYAENVIMHPKLLYMRDKFMVYGKGDDITVQGRNMFYSLVEFIDTFGIEANGLSIEEKSDKKNQNADTEVKPRKTSNDDSETNGSLLKKRNIFGETIDTNGTTKDKPSVDTETKESKKEAQKKKLEQKLNEKKQKALEIEEDEEDEQDDDEEFDEDYDGEDDQSDDDDGLDIEEDEDAEDLDDEEGDIDKLLEQYGIKIFL